MRTEIVDIDAYAAAITRIVQEHAYRLTAPIKTETRVRFACMRGRAALEKRTACHGP